MSSDWIVNDAATPTVLAASGDYVTLSNGLLSRTFAVSPCFGTVELELLPAPGSTFFRALFPEATLTLNGSAAIAVGGCVGQGRVSEWFDPAAAVLAQDPTAFSFAGCARGKCIPRMGRPLDICVSPCTSQVLHCAAGRALRVDARRAAVARKRLVAAAGAARDRRL